MFHVSPEIPCKLLNSTQDYVYTTDPKGSGSKPELGGLKWEVCEVLFGPEKLAIGRFHITYSIRYFKHTSK